MKKKISKFQSVLPKMSARSGLVGKKSSRPYLGPSEAIFSIGRKNPKNAKILLIFLGGPMGPIHPLWGWGWCRLLNIVRHLSSHCHWWIIYSALCIRNKTIFRRGRGMGQAVGRVAGKICQFELNESSTWPQTGWIGPIGLPRKISKFCAFFAFFRSMEKMASDGPK